MAIKESVFLFPHQDDEFGVFYAIKKELLSGNNVWCIYLTDGGEKAKKRNQESLKVLSGMGVEPDNILFIGMDLGIADGMLVDNLGLAADWLLDFLKAQKTIEHIYIPAWEGGHPDHDALYALTVSITHKLGFLQRVRQFSLYNSYQCPAPFFRVMSPLTFNGPVLEESIPILERFKYIWFCLSYPSQTLTWLGLFPSVLYSYLFIGKQSLQKVSLERLHDKPHKGLLYYERRGFTTWNQMKTLISEYLL